MNDFLNSKLSKFVKNERIAVEIVSERIEERNSAIENFAVKDCDIDAKHTILLVDAQKCNSFMDFLKNLFVQIINNEKFKSANIEIPTLEEVMEVEDPDDLKDFALGLFKHDFANEDIYVMLIIDNYDVVGDVWEPNDFDWVRNQLYEEADTLSIMLVSKYSASVVSPEPLGDSPLYNVISPADSYYE